MKQDDHNSETPAELSATDQLRPIVSLPSESEYPLAAETPWQSQTQRSPYHNAPPGPYYQEQTGLSDVPPGRLFQKQPPDIARSGRSVYYDPAAYPAVEPDEWQTNPSEYPQDQEAGWYPPEREFSRNHTGYLSPEERDWYRRGRQGQPKQSWVALLIILVVIGLVVGGGLLLFMILPANPAPTQVVPGPGPTTLPTALATSTVRSLTVTAGPFTVTAAVIAPSPVPTVTPLPSPTAEPTPLPSPTVSVDEDWFKAGKVAFENKRWAEAIEDFKKVTPGTPAAEQSRPLLIGSYIGLAQEAIDQGQASGHTLELAQTTFNNYKEAFQLSPDSADLARNVEWAQLYLDGRTRYQANQWTEAEPILKSLYSKLKAISSDTRYRDTSTLYYNCLVSMGQDFLKLNRFQEAKDKFSLARNLSDVGDKKAAEEGLKEVENKINPPTVAPTATATVAPTATSRPPTATPSPQPTAVPTSVPSPAPTAPPLSTIKA